MSQNPKCPSCGSWLESGALLRASRFWERLVKVESIPFWLSGSISMLAVLSTPVFLLVNLVSPKQYWCWHCGKEFSRDALTSRVP